ncbi:MAG: OmpA family protein [Rikenellaceae bacterium]
MKNILFLLAATILISSCSTVKRLQKDPMITTNPTTIDLTADGENPLVDVSYQINVPAKYVPRRAQLVYQPQFLTTENGVNLTPVVINGKKIAKHEKRMLKKGLTLPYPDAIRVEGDKKPVSVDYDVQAPFLAWMPNSELVGWTLLNCCKKHKELIINRQIIAEGVMPPMGGPGPVLTKEVTKQTKTDQEQTEKICFMVNSSEYDPNLADNAKNESNFKSLLAKINSSNNMTLKGINVIGSASPEGTTAINNKLASSRAEKIKNMLTTNMALSPNMLTISSIGADWNGFKTLVQNSSLTNKDHIIKIADSNLTDWAKTEQLRKLNNFNIIKSSILPKLRTVTCEVNYIVTNTTTEWVPK